MNRWLKISGIVFALIIIVITSLAAGILIGSNRYDLIASSPNGDEPSEFKVFWQAWDTVERNFVDQDALDSQAMTYGAIRGMVQALGDEGHTAFLTPEERERQTTELSGSFSGIGAQLGVR